VASDQHQPASSRAIATLATTWFFPAFVEAAPLLVQPPVAVLPRLEGAIDSGPAVPHRGSRVAVRGSVTPGRLDEQPAHMGITGFGD
jgi:hypothetical protein